MQQTIEEQMGAIRAAFDGLSIPPILINDFLHAILDQGEYAAAQLVNRVYAEKLLAASQRGEENLFGAAFLEMLEEVYFCHPKTPMSLEDRENRERNLNWVAAPLLEYAAMLRGSQNGHADTQ